MSSVVIAGDTSGSVTLQAPATAGSTVLTLPATSGTVVTTATTTGISGSAITTGTVGVSVGGTGANTLTANNVILGNGTSAVQFVAPGSSGNVLTSNGTTWTSAAAASGQIQSQLFTAPGTWTKPASCTQVRVTVIGGGGSGTTTPIGGTSGTTSSFGPAVSSTGGVVNPGIVPGTNGVGTVSVGTALKTGAISISGSQQLNQYVTFGIISGNNQNNNVGIGYPAGLDYSTSLNYIAGAVGGGGGTYGGMGGLAVAIVPVSAPVTVTVGTGGARINPSPGASSSGVGGAVLVEFVG